MSILLCWVLIGQRCPGDNNKEIKKVRYRLGVWLLIRFPRRSVSLVRVEKSELSVRQVVILMSEMCVRVELKCY